LEEETLRHFQALLRIDTSDPPGNEAPAVDYLKSVLERDGIPVRIFAIDPKRPNLVARLKGNGSKKPLLIMGHTDVVGVQAEKWKHPPFGAARDGGYVYGRGTVDDKDNLTAALMVMLTLKRLNVPLDRDVIFLAEAGEEGSVRYGIQYMVQNHWDQIEAEFCLAEGGGVYRRNGKLHRMNVGTSEKIPYAVRLIARGPSGHGSRPLENNAVLHLAQAVAKAGTWRTPMRLNDTTRAYFERLATVSAPEDAARFNGITNPEKSEAIQDYFSRNDPGHYSMLRTSISPTILNAGFRVNVIPSEAVATLDIRATPDEDLPKFLDDLRKIINDPNVEVVRTARDTRPGAPPSRLDSEMFRIIETAQKQHYPGALTLPTMNTGATDMAYLRAKGVQCYGIGPMVDEEDAPKGFGAHSDQERILETSLHQFVRFHWDLVVKAAAKP
jgi:acetylornithine deacetylase/succinyl-diaminopimelate desuccinylase-like protein